MSGRSLLNDPFASLTIRCLIWVTGFILSSTPLKAQTGFAPIAIPLEDLPSQSVYDLLVDSTGYLWLGTDAGLVRYDGTELVTLPNPGEGSRAATEMLQDQDGTIYYHNFSGELFSYRGQEPKLEYGFFANGMGRIQNVCRDRKGKVYVATERALYHLSGGQWVDELAPHKDSLMSVQGIYLTNHLETDLVAVCKFEVNNYLLKNPGLRWELFPRMRRGRVRIGSTPVGSALVFENDSLVYLLNPEHRARYGDFIPLDLPKAENDLPSRLIGLRLLNGQYWILTYNGAYRYQYKGGRFKVQQSIMEGYEVSDMVTDREGHTWVSTLGAGAYMIPSLEILSQSTFHTPLRSRAVSDIAPARNGEIMIGGAAGVIARINEQGQFQETYSMPVGGLVQTLLLDTINDLHLMGVFDINVLPANSSSPRSTRLGIMPKVLVPLPGGGLMIGTISGIFLVIDPDLLPPDHTYFRKEKLANGASIRVYGEEVFRLTQTRVRDAILDGNKVWIAAADGLFTLDLESFALQQVLKDDEAVKAKTLARPSGGGLIVGPLGGGLLYRQQGQWESITTGNDLEKLTINCLLAYHEHLYIGSNRGLWTYHLANRTFTRLEKGDGLPSNEILDITINENGIWLATGDGVAFVPEGIDGTNRIAPPVSVRKLAINERDTVMTNQYRLDHRQNNLKFELGTICYGAMGKYHFDYRLVGLDTTWLTLPNGMHEVRYPSLPPGDYRFEARAYNEDDVRSAVPTTMEFSIVPAVWQRWWFLPAISLAVLGLILYGLWIRFRVLRRQDRLVTERAEARLQVEKSERARRQSQLSALRSQMNPHFIYNILNTLQSFILNNEQREANRYLGHFSTLMRMALEFSRQEFILLAEELELLEAYLELEGPRFGNDLHWEVKMAADIDPQSEEVPPLIIQPFVENAFKHGLLHRKGEKRLLVGISLDKTGEFLEIVIEDNGVGREKARLINERKPGRGGRRSFATAAARERLDLINEFNSEKIGMKMEDLYDAAGTGAGTRVSLRLPRL